MPQPAIETRLQSARWIGLNDWFISTLTVTVMALASVAMIAGAWLAVRKDWSLRLS